MWCALRPHYGAAKAWCEIGRPMALRKCAGNAFLGVAVREIVKMAFMAAALLEYTGRHFLAIMLHLMVFAHKVESNCCLLSNVSEPIWKACLQVIVSMSAPALTRQSREANLLCAAYFEKMQWATSGIKNMVLRAKKWQRPDDHKCIPAKSCKFFESLRIRACFTKLQMLRQV